MKAKVWILISSTMLIAGCAEEVVPCDPSPPPGTCMGDPDHPTVTVTNAGGTLIANPHNVCANHGVDLHINLTPIPAAGKGATLPKDPSDTWLKGENKPNPARITLHVPGTAHGDYGYKAVHDDKCLDPMVHVD